MYRVLAGAALTCAALWSLPSSAQDAAMNLGIAAPANDTPLSDQRIYEITFKCEARANLTSGTASRLFINIRPSSSHFIFIADKPPTADSSGNAANPTNPTVLMPVFAVTRGSVKVDNRNACPHTQYIQGGPELYLFGYANYSTTNEPGILLSVGYALAGLVPPLWAMFKGNLSSPVKEQLTSYTETEDPLRKVLTAINAEENYPVAVKLRPGDHVVETSFSRVRISVKYIKSVVKEGGPSAMKAFRKQIETAPQQISVGNLGLCRTLGLDLAARGFSKTDDIPYALAFKGIRSALNAAQISECLGRDYAVAAAAFPGGLWEYGETDQLVTVERAKADYPPLDPSVPYQPAFSVLETKTFRFTNSLSRLTRSDVIDVADQLAFAKTLQQPVALEDKSEAKIFGGASKDYNGSDLADYFISKGYRRFGCYQATAYGDSLDGGKTLLFAFKADKDDAVLAIDNVVILKPIFTEEGLVRKLVVYDEFDWISAAMTARNFLCKRIQIRRPTPATVAASPPASG